VPLNDATSQWMAATRSTVHKVGRLGRYQHDHTIRVGICATAAEIGIVKQELGDRFGDRIVFQNLLVPAYAVEVLEIFDPAVNKWEGILHVARRHGVEPEQIVAIGDDVNDIPMIRNAGLGVAMGNARPEVQAVAKRIIGANHDEGLAAFLDELVASHAVEPAISNEKLKVKNEKC
ncbi:MAG TPA: HAD hydrolase family protein, partial [Humisphaera sp.]|nr:HAD hydrolase family protein [Humisphaera sp.]